jgi:hypothetical protein
MDISVVTAPLDDIRLWRNMYRLEMSCQIVHDSIHSRPGWTQEYRLILAGTPVGYGSVAVGGPWTGQPTIYEFYVLPMHRSHVFDLFRALLETCGAVAIETQSNDVLTTVMLQPAPPFDRRRPQKPLTCPSTSDPGAVSWRSTDGQPRRAAFCSTTTGPTATSTWMSRRVSEDVVLVPFSCKN